MKGKNKRIFWFHSSYVLWETAKIVIKEQLKQENQRKLFEKLLFMTIRPEFNNSRLLRSFCSSLIAFSVLSFRCFGGFVPVVSFRCSGRGFSTCPRRTTDQARG